MTDKPTDEELDFLWKKYKDYKPLTLEQKYKIVVKALAEAQEEVRELRSKYKDRREEAKIQADIAQHYRDKIEELRSLVTSLTNCLKYSDGVNDKLREEIERLKAKLKDPK